MFSKILRLLLVGSAASLIAGGSAGAAGCIEGPLTIIVPRSPGGGLDLLGRMVGEQWAKTLGVDVVIQNVEGAGGAIGLAQAYRAPADGRTVVSWSPPGEYILQLQGRVPFTTDEWEMIGATNSDPGFIAVRADSSFQSVDDIVKASKGDKRLAAGTVGRTTISALEAMLYESLFDVKWGLVPFDGGGDLTTAVLGGHVDFVVREGGLYDLHPEKLRILSVASDARITELPDVPTLEEATGKKLSFAAYRGFAVRKGTPAPVLECLRQTFNQAAQSPEIADNQFQKIGFRYQFLDAAAFGAANESQAEITERFKSEILGD
jgi:tripartite-type tricarboxylate transporter receptor subunit TctC